MNMLWVRFFVESGMRLPDGDLDTVHMKSGCFR